MKLVRTKYRPDGIFGTLSDDQGNFIAYTLEHSFGNLPIIPPGQYICVRGQHRLHNMTSPFETFEITGVKGHSNLLFHWGNFNRDSEGCVLLGDGDAFRDDGSEMITGSKVTFAKFMKSLDGVKEFMITVS